MPGRPENVSFRTWASNRKNLLTLLGTLLAVGIAFSPMLNNTFTNWDDQLYVTENPLLADLSWSGIVDIFSTNVVSNYHPITILSLAINYQISGLNPSSYLWTNLLLHLLNTFLVFLFIFKLSRGKAVIALIVSLFFGIHPMHVESVAWISERKDVLYTFFLLLGLIAYLRYLHKRDVKRYLITLALFALSLLSKPAAVVFPVLLLLIDYLKKRKFTSRLLLEKAPFFALSLIIGIVTIQIQSVKAMEVMERFDLTERLLFAGYGFVMYIVRLFFPWPLAALHPFPEAETLPAIYYLSPIIALGILGLVYYYRRHRALVFGVLFYLVSIAPVLQLLTIGNAVVAERYTYVPYIGLLFIIGYFYHQVTNGKTAPAISPGVLRAVMGIIAVVFAVLTFQQTKVWRNSETLWTDALQDYPDSRRAYFNRALHYFKQQNYGPALADLDRALLITPNYVEALEYRGRTHLALGDNQKAYTDFNHWVNIDPQNGSAYSLQGLSLFRLDRTQEALAAYNQALQLDPNDFNVWTNRGTLYFNKLKNYQQALSDFNQAISLNPEYGPAYLNRSRAYYMLNDRARALEEARKAEQLGEPIPPDYLQLIQ